MASIFAVNEEKIKSMELGNLVQEMCCQLIQRDLELKNAEASPYSSETKIRRGIIETYQPILRLLRREMNLYHK